MKNSELILRSTIRIQADNQVGTGFFFRFDSNEDPDKKITVIVTNKHVVENTKIGRIRFTICDDDNNPIGLYFDITIPDFWKKWYSHPDGLDLCILPMKYVFDEAEKQGVKLLYSYFSEAELLTEEELYLDLEMIERIHIIGYPNGIWDEANNLPIVREGMTATPVQTNYSDQPVFLVDAAIFGGSSGSPVVLYNEYYYTDRNGINVGKSRVKLLGIVYAGYETNINGQLEIINIQTVTNAVVRSKIPSNLGIAIKANKLLDFKTLFK